MANYYPLTIARSDGVAETNTNGVREPNQPTDQQISDTPDHNGNVDCYRKCGPNDLKVIDWKRKIGGMTMHYLGGKAHSDRNYILKELPEGYTVWEHVKYNVNKMAEKEKGRHAGGTFERQDAYLYGHPHGRRKRFRSPADAFPHFLWLATDPEGDPRNCSCKLCSPDGDPDEVVDLTAKSDPVKKEIEIKFAPAMTPDPPKKPAPAPVQAPPKQQPALAVPIMSLEQKADFDPNSKYLYRPGESVWFSNGMNWRLGVISKRGLLSNKPRYLIQPLSNPVQHQPAVIKDDEAQLRPWLAWSVPNTTIPQLNNMEFDQVPWDRVVRHEFDQGQHPDYVVDGSILAAKVIDASYSFFERDEKALSNPGEVHYKGIFLGAEKIWVGEPVRLKGFGVTEIIVMIIQKLIENTSGGNSKVTFIGDIYKFVEMPMPYNDPSTWPIPNLPPRMVYDLRWRNEVSYKAKRGIWYEWRLLEPAARKGLDDVKGRWYETRTLLPILSPSLDDFEANVKKGKTSDTGAWMNGRRERNQVKEVRRKNRRDTLGRSVPEGFKVSRGLNGPAEEDKFPDELQAAQQQQQMHAGQNTAQQGYVESDLAQYMDLDQGQQYYGQ